MNYPYNIIFLLFKVSLIFPTYVSSGKDATKSITKCSKTVFDVLLPIFFLDTMGYSMPIILEKRKEPGQFVIATSFMGEILNVAFR